MFVKVVSVVMAQDFPDDQVIESSAKLREGVKSAELNQFG
jgi:hypothetical protein